MTEKQMEKAERVRDTMREDGYPTHCYNIKNNCEPDENCECGKVIKEINYVTDLIENGNKRTIGEILDKPGLGSAIMTTRVFLKRYVRGLMN